MYTNVLIVWYLQFYKSARRSDKITALFERILMALNCYCDLHKNKVSFQRFHSTTAEQNNISTDEAVCLEFFVGFSPSLISFYQDTKCFAF